IALRSVQLVGVLVGRRDQLAAAVDDESRSGAPDLELRQEAREPGVFDDDGEDALPLLVDIDRTGKGNRWPLAGRMVHDLEPLRLPGRQPGLEPGAIGDAKIGRLETAIGEFDIAGHHLVLVDAWLAALLG